MQQLIESVSALSSEKRKALAILLSQKGVNLYGIAPIFRRDADEPLRLSYAQERQWFLWNLEPHSAAYHIPTALRLRGALDMAALQRSFATLIERHEVLRSVFVEVDGQLLQQVRAPFALPLPVQVLTDAGQLEQAVAGEIAVLFDLGEGPLLRARLLQVSEDDHVLVLTQHHIISDGASMQLMVEELINCYGAFSRGQQPELPALPIQYADYALWQRQWMEAGERERQLAYWTTRLGGEQPVLELPLDRPRPALQSLRGARLDIELSAELGKGLQEVARQQGATLYMVLLASFQALLHRYSRQRDIRVGVPIGNRNRAETERLIGFFVNTQVLSAEVDGQAPFTTLLQQAKETALGAQEHQDLPFEQLVEALAPERNLSHSPLFQVLFNHQAHRGAGRQAHELPGLRVESLNWESQTAQFDLMLDTHEEQGQLWASLTYATDLFDSTTIERLAGHWQALLEGIVSAPGTRVSELPMLTTAERAATLAAWNTAPATFAPSQPLHRLIEAQAARAPQAPALVCEGEQLSYAELNRRANRIAHALIARGVGPDVLVGLAAPRSLEMVVGLLAILKAGGAYVPLDPAYPLDRLHYMIEDSGLQLLLGQGDLGLSLAANVQVLDLAADYADFAEVNPNVAVDLDNLAYVIYTSGSTGKPKGTLLPHRNVLRLFEATDGWFGFGPQDCWTLFHSYAFDFSVWELFGALLHGGRLVIVPQDVSRSPEAFYQLLCEQRVTVLNQTPSAFRQLMQVACAEGQRSDQQLRYVVFGGEALEVGSLRPWFERFGDRAPQLVNMYGITETTVHVTYRPLSLADLAQSASSPIGVPIPDQSLYVLDSDLNPVAAGCVGELYVGRQGLARGYLKRADLSATRFIPDPFGESGARLYRSGDLARWRADGVIEYVGRMDHQVKIRGFRIELGEIQARLQALPQVREAVVLAQEGASGTQLVGYLVAEQAVADQAIWREAVKAALREDLPEYMVPAHLLLLERMPLTANGKLDRRALPAADASLLQQAYVAPQSEMEQRIAAVWADVLRLERVGLSDNFFELGGDSIISIQVVSRARQAGIHFTPKELFQHQTVQGLARVAREGGAAQRIDQGAVQGGMPLLPVQQWFFGEVSDEAHHWNQSVLLRPTRALQAATVEAALQALLVQHDALRLRFTREQGQWQASHGQPGQAKDLLWQRQAADQDALLALCEAAQRSLSLEGPLLRAVLVGMGDGSQRLLLVIHHLVIDGVSWRVLFEDLQQACAQLDAQQPVRLPAKTSAYKAWAERLGEHARSDAMARELAWWQGQLADAPQDLPCANPAGGQQNRHARSLHTRLDSELTRQLLQQAPAAYRTQVNDLLLTALARVVGRWSAQHTVLIQLEGHGREDLFDDIDLTRTVGWFTTLFPLALTPAQDLAGSIKAVKEQLRAVPSKGIGYGMLRHLGDAAVQAGLAALPVPRITFNYLGQFDGSFDAEQGALFVPVGEPRGEEQSPAAPLGNWLTLNGQVYGGELAIGWTYSHEMFDEATVQALADDYAAELKALIAHCCDSRHAGVTPSDFPLARLDQAHLDQLLDDPRAVEDVYPLSPMQQGMLFHSLYGQGNGDYINQMRVTVEGLQVERFRAAWQASADAQPILRSRFAWEGDIGQPLQIVQRQVQVPFDYLDWHAEAEPGARLDALAEAERARGFDLREAPLLRMTVVRTGEQRFELIYTNHHILMDGWSNSQLMGEVLQRYAGQAPAQAGRYRDYIDWLQRQDPAVSEAFWRERLAELEAPTRLAQGLQTEPGSGYASHVRLVDAERTQRLETFARQQKVTVNTLLQAAWLLLLQRYSGQATVAFGATVAGRPLELPGIEQQIGLFINTLPVIATPQPAQSVADWLQAVQALNLGLREHEHTPLFDIQRWAGQGGDALFDSLLVFENYPVAEALERGAPQELRFGSVDSREQTNYPLTLGVNLGGTLELHYSFMRAHFDEAAIVRLDQQLIGLMEQFSQAPTAALGNLSLLDSQAQQALAVANAPQPWQDGLLVHQRIAAQAARRPQAPSVLFGDQVLDFASLERQANQLAHRLVAEGVGAEIRVGVALPRGPQVIVALLAVLKAGGAYVPLDASYPAERLAYLMQDSGIALLLTDSTLRGQLPLPAALAALNLDQLDLTAQPTHAPQTVVQPQSLAYVIYTSGSTGKPKGVCVEHGPLAMHCEAIGRRYAMVEDDCELHFMSFAFDGAHERWLTALTHGSRLLVRDDSLWEPGQTCARMCEHGVTVAAFPPAYLLQMAEHVELHGQAPKARIYCFGGDAVPRDSYQRVHAALAPEHIINGYGPTETVVTPLIWKADRATDCGAAYAPIGTRIGDRRTYVLAADLSVLPAGLQGELYLGGHGLARGYLDRPGMTAERFVPDPHGEPGARLYRSGDLVRERRDGVFDYQGRVDNQVKIRGFRVELGEVEARLLAQAGVRDAAVVARPGPSGQQLVGYVVALQPGQADAAWCDALRASLREVLPDYMVPAHVLSLASMPLTPNGKLDRKALPQPEAGQSRHDHQPPRTALEQTVAAIWADVLKLPQVGLHDHFFELGGHSLLATQVVARVRHALQVEVALRTLFEHGTLQAFCAQLSESADAAVPAIGLADRSRALALSYAQERQWFLWQLAPDSAAYHIPVALRLRGALRVEALRRAFEHLVARHESLRTVFVHAQGRTEQVIQAPYAFELPLEVLADASDAALLSRVEQEVARPFDLGQGPLLRACLLRQGSDEHVLVLVMHHIVSDGVSMQVMVDELVALYDAFDQGQAPSLAPLPIQYADYAVWQRQWMDAGERERQLTYWVERLGGTQPVLELPLDHPRPAMRSQAGASLTLALPGELQQALRALAREQGVTLFMLLLAAYQTLLHRYSGQSDIRVGVPIANRNHARTEGMIGFFVNTQVLKVEFAPQATFAALLGQVRQAALEAQAYQDLPFEQLVEALAPERNLSHSPLFQALFNYQSGARRGQGAQQAHALSVEGLQWDTGVAQFDLTLDVFDSEEGVLASLVYATDLFERSTIERLSTHFINLLQGIVEQPQQPVAELPLLAAAERERTLVTWNATAENYPLEQSIQQLIEAQVQRTPDAPALAFGETRLSYAQLNARANRLAHRLIALGVGADVLVGIAVERSVEMVVGLLAILKAGGAYVPLDPEYPEERLRYMIEDSGVQLLLTQSHLQLPLAEGVQTLALDLEPGADDARNPNVAVAPENLAYVIYTSGSTGRPKGAGNRHSALVNRLCWMQQAYRLDARDSVLQKTPFSFDVSVWEFFWPLMTGARLVVAAPGDHRDPARLVELITGENITTLHFVPSMLQAFLQDSGVPRCTSLARIVCSGEALPADAQQQVFAKLPKAGLYNLYGPTEAAIDVTHWTCREEGRDSVPIGEPIANLACYILDAELQPVPVGVLGELYLAGAGLARGYHRRPGLTAERFAVSPYGNGERIYRTGDLARYRADGVIEYAGRIDHQVKLRGLRIELGEIEARLLEHDLVREAVVTVPDGKQLVGYVVLTGEAADWQAQLAEHLRRGLPDYMVPNQWLALDSLPLSPNGKLDRKALPAVDAAQSQRAYVAPQSELEQQVAAIWAQVLGLERVGLTDNFFELGGHSLLVINIVSRIQLELGLKLVPQLLFQYPVLGALVAQLQATGAQVQDSTLSRLEDLLDDMEGL
ncbi:non-ribosomal peptide synthase/polyketide synthase [Pseudomonas putida]|uniref:non-ribosomal peptide synthase/polyketide synthase n=5 Tax=Pseudomonas TaxID=286 RepID=UPI002263E744|nr:non-ribosomal peptide synthase/polyketide synthase [Pseudomonas putida]